MGQKGITGILWPSSFLTNLLSDPFKVGRVGREKSEVAEMPHWTNITSDCGRLFKLTLLWYLLWILGDLCPSLSWPGNLSPDQPFHEGNPSLFQLVFYALLSPYELWLQFCWDFFFHAFLLRKPKTFHIVLAGDPHPVWRNHTSFSQLKEYRLPCSHLFVYRLSS